MSTSSDVQRSENLLPRRYQEEVFSQAQDRNVIAALDTGSGKTFISTLLVKWISSRETSKGKVIIFLVPKVTLVEQQGDFIAKHSPLRVIRLHGALEIDLTDRVGWRKKFERYDVFVMTPQIFMNLLTHSHWSIDKVSLMVFDECHHARKNHPYNGIMREYFQVPLHRRPKVFGMTASPIWNPKDACESLETLEKNMDATVIGVRAHLEELADHSPKPVEIIKEYPAPPQKYDYPTPSLWMCLHIFDLWSNLDIPWTNIEMRYVGTLSNLGPYCAELYLYFDMQHRITQLVHDYKPPIAITDMDIDSTPTTPSSFSFSSKPLPPELFEIDEILRDYTPFFIHPSDPTTLPIPITLQWCSPKIQVLVDVLLAHRSPTFQGIIFVEQRQVAACLAKILPCVPELKDFIRCAELVGQGVNSEGISKVTLFNVQQDAVKLFRDCSINLLIATSVAEEGLDFPACDIVVRFDPLQHMVGYVQSRGRARNKASTFVIMVQEDDSAHLMRYKSFLEGEPELKRVYQSRQELCNYDEGDSDDEDTDPVDLAERERYVVPSTGAILTYDNSINLLNYLCSLIPCDSFTKVHVPVYTGDFESTLHLPPGLPLSPLNRVYTGPIKRSKKEAKRAVAFLAVQRLHALDVFDPYLLPVPAVCEVHEDADGRSITDVSQVPDMMDVLVRDPWTMGEKLWMHAVCVDGRRLAGLVTGTMLPPTDFNCHGTVVRIHAGELVCFDEDEDWREWKIMHEFTRIGIWYHLTGKPVTPPLSLFLVPINAATNQPDFQAIERLVAQPYGSYDWTGIGEEHYDRIMIMNNNEFGCPLRLRRIRYDLSTQSVPPPGSREFGFPTYHEYFSHRWTGKTRPARVPNDGPLVEAIRLPRSQSGLYSLHAQNDPGIVYSVPDGVLVPQGCCRWVDISEDISLAFQILSPLCHRITDIYRVSQARIDLRLPSINDNLLVEAFTLPSANAGYNNQRLETLGDAVLELCTTVHLFNRYPHRHEGQLSALRQPSISNRCLLARAKELQLEQFLTSEVQSVHTWRYILPEGESGFSTIHARRYVSRRFPRRSLQDCMEATLGASFLTGGIPMALSTGEALGLTFGGSQPWSLRYGREPEASPASALFESLQECLGYTFHRGSLLVEALTHPSFACSSSGSSYQRLEFLGDALLDLVVVKYLYDKFPNATSDQLSRSRARAICATALASLAVRRLGLHKIVLINNVELSIAINQYVPVLETTSCEDIVNKGWKHEPPKVISDIFESVMGAVLVDSAYNYDKAASVVEFVMKDVLAALSPSIRKDPVSELMEWTAGTGCQKLILKKTESRPQVTVLVHDVVVVGPVTAGSLAIAKCLASERALLVLKDPGTELCLSSLCDCGKAMGTGYLANATTIDEGSQNTPLDGKVYSATSTQSTLVAEGLDELNITKVTKLDISEGEVVEMLSQDANISCDSRANL